MTATAEQLDQAQQQRAPSTLQPIGLGMAGAIEQSARDWARRWNLFGEQGQLHCAACSKPIAWHVSLHCAPCRVEERSSRPERLRREREQRQAAEQRAREQEPSSPVQRVGGRSFRDGY